MEFIVVFAAIFIFVIMKICLSKRNDGARAEQDLVRRLIKSGIPPETIFHDLYLEKVNGEFSQIDIVVPTSAGIIVIEIKDYGGWIFGHGKHRQWTQVLAYGKRKYRFYNPIMQNNSHIAALRKKIKQSVPFYSIIVFYGYCEFKELSGVPEGAFIIRPSDF